MSYMKIGKFMEKIKSFSGYPRVHAKGYAIVHIAIFQNLQLR